MKKLEMEYGPLICTIIFYLIFCIRLRKEILMLSLRWKRLTFARDFLSYRSLQGQLWFKLSTRHSCWRLFLIYCILNFVSTTFSMQPQPLFVFLQSVAGSGNKWDKTKSCKLKVTTGYNLHWNWQIHSDLLLWWQRFKI